MKEFLDAVPSEIWTVVVGALVVGLLASLRSRRQLAHDAHQRALEREFAFRREVYLEVAETMTRALRLLGELPTRANSQAPNVSFGKILVVGSNKTVKEVSRFEAEFSKAWMQLSLKKLPLLRQKSQIETLEKFIETSSAERDKLTAIMNEYNLRDDKAAWDRSRSSYEIEKKRLEKYFEDLDRAWKEHNQRLLTLSEECMEKSVEISRSLVLAVCALREDLQIPFDAKAYQALAEEHLTDLESSVNELIKSLRLEVRS